MIAIETDFRIEFSLLLTQLGHPRPPKNRVPEIPGRYTDPLQIQQDSYLAQNRSQNAPGTFT